jgi:PTS system glucitol/sorbitol-specific IIA component
MAGLYQSVVTEIGSEVELFLTEKMMIIFNETAPSDLRDIAVVHKEAKLEEEIEVGDVLTIDNQIFKITFVGQKVNNTIRELGHCTIAFNGADHVDLPGTLCVEEKPIPEIKPGTKIGFSRL